MKLKERERIKLFKQSTKIFYGIWKLILSKKSKIFFLFLIFSFIFLFGAFFGLLVSGFFGTLDSPSKTAINFLHFIGISDLRTIRTDFLAIKNENIKIPLNYINGQFSNPKKIFIDINFENYQKIKYKREKALERGLLIASAEDYVPAKIRTNGKEINVKLRLAGDGTGHLLGDKWSFRIKTRGDDTLFGMRVFTIRNPNERAYLNELIFQEVIKKEGILSLRYDFIEVIINGKNKGIFAIEEHFDKQLIENNNRIEGVILKFDESLWWETREIMNDWFFNNSNWYNNIIDDDIWFYSSPIETFHNNRVLIDPTLSKQFEEARNLLESFRQGSLSVEEVFDINLLAKFFATNTVFGSLHSSFWHNIRFYYNPITSRLEPIGYDANQYTYYFDADVLDRYYLPSCISDGKNNCSQKINFWWDLLFQDKIFFEKYMQELERISEKSYLDNLFLELDEDIEKKLNILHKDTPTYHFPKENYYKVQRGVKNKINPIKSINVYFQKNSQNKIFLFIGNVDSLPLKIINVNYNETIFNLVDNKIIQPRVESSGPINYQIFKFNIPNGFIWNDKFGSFLKINYQILGQKKILNEDVFPWSQLEKDFLEKSFMRQKSNINGYNLLVINNVSKTIEIKSGNWILNESLIIPKGYKVIINPGTSIDLVNNATILSYSALQFFGKEKSPIEIISSDNTGQGLVILNAEEYSNLNYVIFKNLTNPSKEGWRLTGAITFYKSPFIFNNIKISNANSEDGLNAIGSQFNIKNSVFENCFSDCFDSDFSNGILESSIFIGCGNDCIDFSGSKVEINNVNFMNISDKGISVGEESEINAIDIIIKGDKINKGYIAIASKDMSKIFINGLSISRMKYGFAVYQKKPEFGPSEIRSENILISDTDIEYIVEEDSNLLLDNSIILDKEKNVYETLYPLNF